MKQHRRKKAESVFIGLAVAVGGIGLLISKAVDVAGLAFPIVVIGILVACVVGFKYIQRQRRIEYLLDKYGDEAIVERIMHGVLWQGQSAEQLVDTKGDPLAVDKKLMVTRKREVWKYHQTGRGRYALRVTLDNDVVIEIDQKTS